MASRIAAAAVTNKYLSYDAERAPQVRALFTRIAARYDLVNDIMSFGLHRRWKRQTVELALKGTKGPRVLGARGTARSPAQESPRGTTRSPAQESPRGTSRSPAVLDLCCGSGDLAFLAQDGGGGLVVGADFTLAMLAVARQRRLPERRRTGFLQADALSLPFADGSFDVVTVGYGLRNIADIPAALAEMRRVLAPGGRAVVLDFGKPANPLAGLLYRALPAHDDAGRRMALPRRSRDTTSTFPSR